MLFLCVLHCPISRSFCFMEDKYAKIINHYSSLKSAIEQFSKTVPTFIEHLELFMSAFHLLRVLLTAYIIKNFLTNYGKTFPTSRKILIQYPKQINHSKNKRSNLPTKVCTVWGQYRTVF